MLRQGVGVVELLPRARMPAKVPVVLSPSEVRRVLDQLTGVPRIVAMLLYGAGLRVMLPDAVRKALEQHLEGVRRLHHADLAAGFGRVVLPGALERKYPNAPTDWSWQFVCPAGWGAPSQ